jgi:hypothetical protein
MADLTGVVTATLGKGGSFSLHSPAFSNGYFTSVSTTHWLLYERALSTTGTNINLWAATFSAGHVMNSGTPADSLTVGGSMPVEFSPLTEFQNGVNDQVFVSGLTAVTPNFVEYSMNAFLALFPTSFPPGANGATGSETGGTSGMVVDDNSGSAQVSSIYFGTLTGDAAIKVTQSGLH